MIGPAPGRVRCRAGFTDVTPLFDWIDSAPADVVYLAIGVLLLALALTEQFSSRRRT